MRNADQLTVADKTEAVASRAHLLVHFVASTDGFVVESLERTIVRPGVVWGVLVQVGSLNRLVKRVEEAKSASADSTSGTQILIGQRKVS